MQVQQVESAIWDEFGTTRACLVLDSTGFTRTTRDKGIVHFLTVVAQMRNIAQAIIVQFHGLNYRFEADNIYVEFNQVDDAVKTALAIHAAIDGANLRLNASEKFQGCIGIGFGQVLMAGHEGVFGDEMNLASKLGEDIAEGGETLLSENAWANLQDKSLVNVEKRYTLVSKADIHYWTCI